jgi:hypothetical protein
MSPARISPARFFYAPAPAERRAKFRYPLQGLDVRFSSCGAPFGFSGTGRVLNMSSSGILVASQQQVSEGALVELRIEWPLLLDGKVPLQFHAFGRVLRRGRTQFAASFERYEFRTMKSFQPTAGDRRPMTDGAAVSGTPSSSVPAAGHCA